MFPHSNYIYTPYNPAISNIVFIEKVQTIAIFSRYTVILDCVSSWAVQVIAILSNVLYLNDLLSSGDNNVCIIFHGQYLYLSDQLSSVDSNGCNLHIQCFKWTISTSQGPAIFSRQKCLHIVFYMDTSIPQSHAIVDSKIHTVFSMDNVHTSLT